MTKLTLQKGLLSGATRGGLAMGCAALILSACSGEKSQSGPSGEFELTFTEQEGEVISVNRFNPKTKQVVIKAPGQAAQTTAYTLSPNGLEYCYPALSSCFEVEEPITGTEGTVQWHNDDGEGGWIHVSRGEEDVPLDDSFDDMADQGGGDTEPNAAITDTSTDTPTNPKCYDAANAKTVGQAGWNGCAGMYIASDKADLETGVKSGFKITHTGIDYTFGDSDHNVFTGQVTEMNFLFYHNEINEDIGYWDTSNVTNMESLFDSTYSFNQDIGDWDTSNVTNMKQMFLFTGFFNQDIGNWDTSNVTDMESMFLDAESFNQDLSRWNVKQINAKPDWFDNSVPSEWTDAKKPQWGTAGKN